MSVANTTIMTLVQKIKDVQIDNRSELESLEALVKELLPEIAVDVCGCETAHTCYNSSAFTDPSYVNVEMFGQIYSFLAEDLDITTITHALTLDAVVKRSRQRVASLDINYWKEQKGIEF